MRSNHIKCFVTVLTLLCTEPALAIECNQPFRFDYPGIPQLDSKTLVDTEGDHLLVVQIDSDTNNGRWTVHFFSPKKPANGKVLLFGSPVADSGSKLVIGVEFPAPKRGTAVGCFGIQ